MPDVLTLTEAKQHLQLPADDDSFDTFLQGLINEAVGQFEDDTGHVLSTRANVESRLSPGADFDLLDSHLFVPLVDFTDAQLAARNFTTTFIWRDRPDQRLIDANVTLLEGRRTRIGSLVLTYYRNTADKLTPFAPVADAFVAAFNGVDRPNGVITADWQIKVVATKQGLEDSTPDSFKIPIKMIMQHAFQHGQTNIYGTNQLYTSMANRHMVNLSVLNKREWLSQT